MPQLTVSVRIDEFIFYIEFGQIVPTSTLLEGGLILFYLSGLNMMAPILNNKQ